MKRMSLDEIKRLPDGTRVWVECVGSEWCLDESDLKSWNIKHDDGLYYDSEKGGVSFEFNYDYNADNLNRICYVGEYGCDCCLGDEPIFKNNSNGDVVFIDGKRELFISIKGNILRAKVDYCPKCGRKFDKS